MVGSAALALGKAAAALLTDEETRKRVGWVIVAILSPVIVIAALLCALGAGTAQHNVSAAELCFQSGAIPNSIPAEYRILILEMRESFVLLNQHIDKVNGMVDEGDGLDDVRVKAMFFSLYFGQRDAAPISRLTAQAFVGCFVTWEERTREVEEDDGTASTETYTVAIPIGDMDTVWRNIQAAMEVEATAEARANAESVYNLIQYGWSQGGEWSGELGGPILSADGFCSPLGAGWQSRVTSEYGWRICPYHGRELHSGLDMAAPSGTPIRAALGGTVIKSVYNGSYGNYTMIDHGNGLTTAYAHQSQRLVSVGDVVEAGEVIGLVGSTGNSTGAHLHLEVRVNGQLQNPRSYLP